MRAGRDRAPGRDDGGDRGVGRSISTGRPFVLLAQQSLFDRTRAPAGKHTAWAYCHVPNGSTEDMTDAIEAQVERFAPGFRERVLARHVFTPADLERRNANLVGGDIGGGAMDLRQLIFRPTWRVYRTPLPWGVYLFVVHAAGRRRPRDVRIQRGEGGVGQMKLCWTILASGDRSLQAGTIRVRSRRSRERRRCSTA